MWNVDNLEKWDAPQALREYLPYGLMGFDNEGSPGKLRDLGSPRYMVRIQTSLTSRSLCCLCS